MDGVALIQRLKLKLDVATDSALASELGYSLAGVHQIKGRAVTERQVAEIVAKAKRRAEDLAADAISPVVEFFPLNQEPILLDTKRPDHAKLKAALNSACGLYCFYNSEIEIIYIGKTVTGTLWSEMYSVLTQRNMPHYERYKVNHAHGKYSSPSAGVRKITREPVYLSEAAAYFSAYSVPRALVTALETLFIRMIPNDLLNVRMEGNTRLTAYKGKI